MRIDSARTRRVIKAIAARMTRDPALRDDLFQEALIRLWSLQQHRPGQSESWYLQGCKLHLLNYMNQGRSVDSARHLSKRVTCIIDDLPHAGVSNEEIVEWRLTLASVWRDTVVLT
jgi:DNA-directed RNA polymerase specialized sigma24 family protein